MQGWRVTSLPCIVMQGFVSVCSRVHLSIYLFFPLIYAVRAGGLLPFTNSGWLLLAGKDTHTRMVLTE